MAKGMTETNQGTGFDTSLQGLAALAMRTRGPESRRLADAERIASVSRLDRDSCAVSHHFKEAGAFWPHQGVGIQPYRNPFG